MIGLCDNCALKYADCKGNKDLEKTKCDYYKKPIVMNVKELAERVAELEIENERLRRITEEPTIEKCGNTQFSKPSAEWKLASKELPQSVGSYIVTCKDKHGSVYVDYDFWTVADEFKYNGSKVTAWIPFPKPYRGGDTE